MYVHVYVCERVHVCRTAQVSASLLNRKEQLVKCSHVRNHFTWRAPELQQLVDEKASHKGLLGLAAWHRVWAGWRGQEDARLGRRRGVDVREGNGSGPTGRTANAARHAGAPTMRVRVRVPIHIHTRRASRSRWWMRWPTMACPLSASTR